MCYIIHWKLCSRLGNEINNSQKQYLCVVNFARDNQELILHIPAEDFLVLGQQQLIIGNAKQEGTRLQPILCKDKCRVDRYGADGERERRIKKVEYIFNNSGIKGKHGNLNNKKTGEIGEKQAIYT